MNKAWIILFIAALITTGALGCGAHNRYRVLCFLFDGVPVPAGEVPCDGNGNPLAPVKRGEKIEEAPRKYAQHGPYAARMCEGCHQRQTNRLLLPATDLCLYCHTLSVTKKNIHGPVASGSCSVCHDPHGSGNEYLLVSKSQDFCLYCHKREDILQNVVHQAPDAENCTSCHNAHASDNEYLLRDKPNAPDEGSPWGKPKQKQPDRKLATTAKVDDMRAPDTNDMTGPVEPK